jgi:transcriptional regulator with XRE-family HTH domain
MGLTKAETAFLKKVGHKMRIQRAVVQMTQAEVAASADIDPGYYSRIENGAVNVSLCTLRKIALALKVSLAELLSADNLT